ncbi:hypothetical protein Tco_1305491 [Tanacetum coccineum]
MIPDEQFHTFLLHGASEQASKMLPYPLAHARLGNVFLIRCIPLVFQHGLRLALIGKSGPTDGANVEAYLRGMLGLGKWASNIRIAWFSFGSFRGVSFGSSVKSLLRMSAPTWRDLLDLSLGLRVVDYHYLLLISWRRYISS